MENIKPDYIEELDNSEELDNIEYIKTDIERLDNVEEFLNPDFDIEDELGFEIK